MATLNEVMKNTADAIREKTGKSELIKPVDFATEIKGISAGGSGESGGSTIEYLDVSGLEVSLLTIIIGFAPLCKVNNNGTMAVGAPFYGLRFFTGELSTKATHVKAIGIDLSQRFDIKDGDGAMNVSLIDFLTMMDVATQADIDSIPRITKEQFYDLNA